MDLGRCPRCATPYTASEIAGFGILRARLARQGGPRLEYTCQRCGCLIHLIPHGEGRYAPPGEPPPPAVPPEERRPPWLKERPRVEVEEDPAEPLEVPAAEPADDASEDEEAVPLGAAEALEILGVPPTASKAAIERAFRERSLTCHPDKVAHLDPEFQQLAERKFKRLQRAYHLLVS
jgi:hypothetical protein